MPGLGYSLEVSKAEFRTCGWRLCSTPDRGPWSMGLGCPLAVHPSSIRLMVVFTSLLRVRRAPTAWSTDGPATAELGSGRGTIGRNGIYMMLKML